DVERDVVQRARAVRIRLREVANDELHGRRDGFEWDGLRRSSRRALGGSNLGVGSISAKYFMVPSYKQPRATGGNASTETGWQRILVDRFSTRRWTAIAVIALPSIDAVAPFRCPSVSVLRSDPLPKRFSNRQKLARSPIAESRRAMRAVEDVDQL